MGRYVEEEEGKLKSIASEERSLSSLKAGSSKLAQKILALLAEEPLYGHQISKRLEMHEQKIYYHVRKLLAAGLIREKRRVEIGGASAKYYTLAAPAFTVRFKELTRSSSIRAQMPARKEFLSPFIKEGKADFLIVVGSPLAHGPEMVQARDGAYAIDLALFLGSQLAEEPLPAMKLDTEFTEKDWNRNLIIIGGPIVNTVAARVNKHLPVRFKKDGKTIISTVTGEEYESDQIGIVVKGKNPKAPKRNVLFIAGRRQAGTKGAIIAFLKHFDEVIKGNQKDTNVMARVVEGRDLDSDGIVDDVTFRE